MAVERAAEHLAAQIAKERLGHHAHTGVTGVSLQYHRLATLLNGQKETGQRPFEYIARWGVQKGQLTLRIGVHSGEDFQHAAQHGDAIGFPERCEVLRTLDG